MEKAAQADYEVHDLIRKRWSPRAFSQKPVGEAALRSLLEAARWAASCFNEQPWRFLVARRENPEEFARMLSCLVEGNQKWAGNAPVLMLTAASRVFARNGKPNRHAFHDVGLATAQMALQAAALGLWIHPMAGFLPDHARELYLIPEDFDPVTAIALGYPGNPADLPEDLQKMELAPRTRRPQGSFVFASSWGKPLP